LKTVVNATEDEPVEGTLRFHSLRQLVNTSENC
jgi:hypothetical protein